ncbi:MAG: hypothetical protein EON61_24015 [Alphaproteobacteria bacterium]|nr:MAG: hypothetical protein EON61_24015 [Alphaproteobacteria bacterium]
MQSKHPKFWAIGAVALAALIACTPAAPPVETAEASAPIGPASAPAPPSAGSTPIGPPPANIDPGYTGAWANIETDCGDPTKVVKLTGKNVTLMAGEGQCDITSIDEQHPTGRSMTYEIKANCVSPNRTGEDTFHISFGASDTVIQFQQNAREPVRLVRCPPGVTP